MSRDLDGWLRYIEQLHPREIDLGLDRPRRVLGALAPGRIAPVVITVAGTNGKGSCCAFLANILQAAGLRTGVYTSPHLQRYNERIAIDGAAVTDDELVRAFERVEQARDTTPLTYFEFGTLAALDLFAAADIDVAVLEVGMGGRLDAVNIVEPDAAIVTSIGIDHVDWLGSDREAIAREKAGVFGRATAAIVGDPDPPQTLLDCATQSGADLRLLGHDFVVESDNGGWQYRSGISCWDELPIPGFGGSEQLRNAACALAALEQLRPQLDLRRAHLVAGIVATQPPGRCHRLHARGFEWWLDVAHNTEAAITLARALEATPATGRTLAVCGFMRGKPVAEFASQLRTQVNAWWCVAADYHRAMLASEVAHELRGVVDAEITDAGSIEKGLVAAIDSARPGDRIVVCGSFLIVGAALDYLSRLPALESG